MTFDTRLLDDLAKAAGGAASLLGTVGKQLKADLQERAQNSSFRADMARQGDLDRLQATVTALRIEQEALKKRVAELESMISGTKKPPASKKSAIKKAVPKAKPVKKTVKKTSPVKKKKPTRKA
jgi:BMFP domain-containing protein YqiC